MRMAVNWLSQIGITLKSLFSSVDSGYKLPSVDLPELYRLKTAHSELLQAYVESLAAVSRLSFLVGMDEVKPPKEGLISRIFRILFWGRFSPFRVLVWRPVIKLYVERHIYKKLQELKVIYTQSIFLVKPLSHTNEDYKGWFEKAKGECEELQRTVMSRNIFWEVFRYFVFILAGLSVTTWGATNLYDLLIKVMSSPTLPQSIVVLGKFVVFTIFAFPLILTFIDAAFTAKRAIFLNIRQIELNSVYDVENRLFNLLNRGKSREFPIDYSVAAFFYLVLIGFLWLFHLGISQLPHPSYAIVIDCTWCLLVPYVFLFFTDVIAPWWKREAKGEL